MSYLPTILQVSTLRETLADSTFGMADTDRGAAPRLERRRPVGPAGPPDGGAHGVPHGRPEARTRDEPARRRRPRRDGGRRARRDPHRLPRPCAVLARARGRARRSRCAITPASPAPWPTQPRTRLLAVASLLVGLALIGHTFGLLASRALGRSFAHLRAHTAGPRHRRCARRARRAGAAVAAPAGPAIDARRGRPAQARDSALVALVDGYAPRQPRAARILGRLVGDAPYPLFDDTVSVARAPNSDAGPTADTAGGSVRRAGHAATPAVSSCPVPGFAVAPGLVVTNAHVVAGESHTTVVTSDRRDAAARSSSSTVATTSQCWRSPAPTSRHSRSVPYGWARSRPCSATRTAGSCGRPRPGSSGASTRPARTSPVGHHHDVHRRPGRAAHRRGLRCARGRRRRAGAGHGLRGGPGQRHDGVRAQQPEIRPFVARARARRQDGLDG